MHQQIGTYRDDLLVGNILGEHAGAQPRALLGQPDGVAVLRVTDHGNPEGAMLHHVAAEPHRLSFNEGNESSFIVRHRYMKFMHDKS